MKQTSILFVIFLFIVSCAYAQESIIFRMEYKPQSQYNQSLFQANSIEISYSGSKEVTDELEKQGMKSPSVKKTEVSMATIIRTGKKTDSTSFPISMEFTKTTTNNGPSSISDGTMLYGNYRVGKAVVYDSVYSPDGKTDEAKKLTDIITQTLAQMQVPTKQMKPGDEFRQETPVSIPAGNTKLDMTVVTIYKLRSIKDNIGFFDVTMDYVAQVMTQEIKVPMSGKGSGQMELDGTNGFFRNYELSLDIETNMDSHGVKMKMNAITTMKMHTTLESMNN